MTTFKRFIPTLAAAVLLFGGSTVYAGPVNFSISAASMTPGAGYGIDEGPNAENGGTLLEVQFTSAVADQAFALNNVGDSTDFLLGTVEFKEPDTGGNGNNDKGGIRENETDDLGVTVKFTFTSPVGMTRSMVASGTATPGSVADVGVDYVLTWSPMEVDFGMGGKVEFSLATLSFSGTETQNAWATVKLLAETEAQIAAVPEPGSMALVGLALAGAGIARRRRAA